MGGRDRRFERSRGAGAEGSVARRSEVIGAWMARGIGGAGSRGSREAGSKEVGLEGSGSSNIEGSVYRRAARGTRVRKFEEVEGSSAVERGSRFVDRRYGAASGLRGLRKSRIPGKSLEGGSIGFGRWKADGVG